MEDLKKYLHDHKVLFVTNGDLFRKSLVLKSYSLYKDLLCDDNFMCWPTRLTYYMVHPYKSPKEIYFDQLSKDFNYGVKMFNTMIEYALYKYDYIVYLDNDMFVINTNNLFEMIKYVIENDIDIVYPINNKYPDIDYSLDDDYCKENKKYICNTFFHIINIKKLESFLTQELIECEPIGSLIFKHNYFKEPYIEFYYNMIKNSDKTHILDCVYLWNDNHDFCGVGIYNQNQDIIGIHTYYSRAYDNVQSRWKEIIMTNESHFANVANYIDTIYNYINKNHESNNNILNIFPYKYNFKESIDENIIIHNEVFEKYKDHNLELNEYTITNN